MAAIYVILKSSDLLIDIASSLGRKLALSDYFIGSFIVGIGTSLPELFTSIAAVFSNVPQLVVPTIYGTIVANIAAGFGLGVIALFCFVRRNQRVRLLSWRAPLAGGSLTFGTKDWPKRFLGIPVAFAVGSVVLTGVFYLFGYFGTWHAVSFLILYSVFIASELKRKSSEHPQSDNDDIPLLSTPGGTRPGVRTRSAGWEFLIQLIPLAATFVLFLVVAIDPKHEHLEVFRDNPAAEVTFLAGLALILAVLVWTVYKWKRQVPRSDFASSVANSLSAMPRMMLVASLAVTIVVVYYSGVAIVEAVEWTSQLFGIGDTVLAASALAVGTSLPDIVVAIKVARQGRHMLLFGHILQSNTFDVFLAMGVCGVVAPLITGYSFEAGLSILCSVLFTVAIVPIIWTRRIKLLPGVLLVMAFLTFMLLLFA